MRLRRYLSFSLLIVFFTISSCVSLEMNPVSGNKRAFGYSWEEEQKIGAEADQEIQAQYGLYDNEDLSKYVTELGQELLSVSHLRRADTPEKFKSTEFTFRVLDSPVVNAFALPGGYVYVTRGLLAHLNNEAQLAVVLGHEIGHVAARHASQRAAEQQFGQIAVIGGAVLGESLGYDGQSILQLSGQTAQLMFLKYGRDDERESDALGVEYSAMNKYMAAEGADFFTSLKRISESQGGGIPTLLSSHPDPGEREQRIPELAKEWADKGYEQTIVDQQEYLQLINRIVYGNNPRSGFERKGIFYHPDLKFKFPVSEGFDLYNQPTAVIMVNKDQDAITQFTLDTQAANPEASVRSLLNQEGITTLEQGQKSFNGLNGYQAVASAMASDSTELNILVSALTYEGTTYRFLSYTNANQYAAFQSVFESVPAGFSELTDTTILNIQPVRLELRTLNAARTLSELLPNELPMDIKPLEVAILNQVELNERLEAGSVVKIPVQ